MQCTKCNSPVDEGALYCKACGNQFAVNEQKQKVNECLTNTKDLIVKKMKTPIFLVVAILFTVVFIGQLSSMLSGGIGSIISGILPFIFMLITTIGLWKCYAAKGTAGVSKSLRQASIFDAYTRVMHTISIVLLSIAAAVLFVICILGGGLFDAIAGSEEAEGTTSGIIAGIVVLVIFGIAITVVSIFKGIYAKRRAYFIGLSNTMESGQYTADKAPVIGSYVLGGYDVISAIFPIVLAVLGTALINSLLGDVFAEMGEIGELINTFLVSMMSGLVLSAISSVVSGGYLILSAVWMASVHKAQKENQAAFVAASARLEELETATQEAIVAENRMKQAAEEADKATATMEAKKMQEQQQQMMQMMMMQMMQNGMNMPNANAAAPAAAPAENAENADTPKNV